MNIFQSGFLLGLFVFTSSLTFAQSNENALQAKADSFCNNDAFYSAHTGIYVIDLQTQQELISINPAKAMKPASTTKLFTTVAALKVLGPQYRFTTTVYYSGSIDSKKHILHGNIYLIGGGDPTTQSPLYADEVSGNFIRNCIDSIKALGIKSIDGQIISHAGRYSLDMVPPAWSWVNMGNYYGAGPNALCLMDNTCFLEFSTGKQGEKARLNKVTPAITGLSFDNGVISDTINNDQSNIFGAPYSLNRYIRGSLPMKRDNFKVKGAIPDPALLLAQLITDSLSIDGISISNAPTTTRISGQIPDTASMTSLARIQSPKLSDIVRETNQRSINLYAENLLLETAASLGVKPETDISAKALKEYWKQAGMDIRGMRLEDGSGLSHHNSLSPQQLMFILQQMQADTALREVFTSSLALAGSSGTLKNMFRGTLAENNLKAKSGSLDGVMNYAGFCTSKTGKPLAFVIMINFYEGKDRDIRKLIEKFMVDIIENY